jgi:hypothetical protein
VTKGAPVLPRRALLRHVWAMIQTRAEAAALIVSLQKSAVQHGLALYAVAAVAGSAFTTAVIVLVAVAAPPQWRVLALSLLTLALLGLTLWAAISAGRHLRREAALFADFTKGLKLDLAMLNLALKDPDPKNEVERTERESAKAAVRDAAVDRAATARAAELGPAVAAGSGLATAGAAVQAAAPTSDTHAPPEAPETSAAAASSAKTPATAIDDGQSELELPNAAVIPPEPLTTLPLRERSTEHGTT